MVDLVLGAIGLLSIGAVLAIVFWDNGTARNDASGDSDGPSEPPFYPLI